MILMDEIGGIELLMPEFRKVLHEILERDYPLFGGFEIRDQQSSHVQ